MREIQFRNLIRLHIFDGVKHGDLFVTEGIVKRPKAQAPQWIAARLRNRVGTQDRVPATARSDRCPRLEFDLHPIDLLDDRPLRSSGRASPNSTSLDNSVGCNSSVYGRGCSRRENE